MKMFPIMAYYPLHDVPNQIREIPWSLIEPHREQAYTNHMQSLERLAQRGGLCPMEAVAVLEDSDYRKCWPQKHDTREESAIIMSQAIARLRQIVGHVQAT